MSNKVLKALLIAPDPVAREAILSGEKTVTLREGQRPYLEGEKVMICCHVDPWCVQAVIKRVVIVPLFQMPLDLLAADGYEDVDAALADLQRFYPTVTGESVVTAVEWTDVQGALVDAYCAARDSGLGAFQS